jgi:hypothetical protein
VHWRPNQGIQALCLPGVLSAFSPQWEGGGWGVVEICCTWSQFSVLLISQVLEARGSTTGQATCWAWLMLLFLVTAYSSHNGAHLQFICLPTNKTLWRLSPSSQTCDCTLFSGPRRRGAQSQRIGPLSRWHLATLLQVMGVTQWSFSHA